jgi:hypothetical protein
VAVSAYQADKTVCYDTVEMLRSRGMRQVNIHLLVAAESMGFVREILDDRKSDKRLKDLNAIVFLGVKPKGRAKGAFHPASVEDYREIVGRCLASGVGFGFDSCSAVAFEHVIQGLDIPEKQKRGMAMMAEPCESALFSFYVNVKGEAWFCSFAESEPDVEPVSVLAASDFIEDVWYAPQTVAFRRRVIECRNERRACHVHEVACPAAPAEGKHGD